MKIEQVLQMKKLVDDAVTEALAEVTALRKAVRELNEFRKDDDRRCICGNSKGTDSDHADDCVVLSCLRGA